MPIKYTRDQKQVKRPPEQVAFFLIIRTPFCPFTNYVKVCLAKTYFHIWDNLNGFQNHICIDYEPVDNWQIL